MALNEKSTENLCFLHLTYCVFHIERWREMFSNPLHFLNSIEFSLLEKGTGKYVFRIRGGSISQ